MSDGVGKKVDFLLEVKEVFDFFVFGVGGNIFDINSGCYFECCLLGR